MKQKIAITIIFGCILFLDTETFAQDNITRSDKLFSMSGFGFAFPIGETSDYLTPKFSTSLGVNLGLGDKGLFLYPKFKFTCM